MGSLLFGSGFLLGIPMFAEAVFYLLLPLAKAMWLETRRNYVLSQGRIIAAGSGASLMADETLRAGYLGL